MFIFNDNAGAPDNGAGAIQVSDNTIPAAQIDGTEKLFSFSSGPVLNAETTYWIVLGRTSSVSDTNYYAVNVAARTSPDAYTRGTLLYSIGTSWFDNDPSVFDDMYF